MIEGKHAVISHPTCLLHEMGEGHPERPERIKVIHDGLMKDPVTSSLENFKAPLADKNDLLRVHDKDYVDEVFNIAPSRGRVSLDPDTSMNPHSLEAALCSAGAAVFANELVFDKGYKTVFCNVRPPGHHAEKDRAMGFCFFNNVAVAAFNALEVYKIKKVAILDFDVHHGNGTEEMVPECDEILFCSSFQHPFYPFATPESYCRNIIKTPLRGGSTGKEFRNAVNEKWLPALEKFQPEVIYVSAGFDAHKDDYLASLNFLDEDFRWIGARIKEVADKYSQGRVVSTLEGGYNLKAISSCVAAYISGLISMK